MWFKYYCHSGKLMIFLNQQNPGNCHSTGPEAPEPHTEVQVLEVSMTTFLRVLILRRELWEVKTTAWAMAQRQAPCLTSKRGALHRRDSGQRPQVESWGGHTWLTEGQRPGFLSLEVRWKWGAREKAKMKNRPISYVIPWKVKKAERGRETEKFEMASIWTRLRPSWEIPPR